MPVCRVKSGERPGESRERNTAIHHWIFPDIRGVIESDELMPDHLRINPKRHYRQTEQDEEIGSLECCNVAERRRLFVVFAAVEPRAFLFCAVRLAMSSLRGYQTPFEQLGHGLNWRTELQPASASLYSEPMILEPVRPIQLSEIQRARERIAKTIVRTPLIRLELGPEFPDIRLKLENLQPINAYKLRGAANAVAALPRS